MNFLAQRVQGHVTTQYHVPSSTCDRRPLGSPLLPSFMRGFIRRLCDFGLGFLSDAILRDLEGRASPADLTAAVPAALLSLLWTVNAQIRRKPLRVQALSWHSALLHQQALGLLRQRQWMCTLLWAKEAQLHQRTLRYRNPSWHCAWRSQEAELHQLCRSQ